MRSMLVLALTLGGISAAAAGIPGELFTAPNAILCVNRVNLDKANRPSVAESQRMLRAMGCLRTEAGIRTRLDGPVADNAWRERFFPTGISSGVVLWALPSAFTSSDSP